MEPIQNREFLKRHALMFQPFSEERLQQIVDGSRAVSFETNQVIAHHGEQATHFGVVLSGTLAAYLPGNGHVGRPVGELKAGETFGEAALMTGNPMLADVVAATPCEVLLVPVWLFQSIIISEPGVVQHASRVIAQRIRSLAADPVKTAAALHKAEDPYGLKLKGERPEKLLMINCGSSSLKYSFYDTEDPNHHAQGVVERIGLDGTRLEHKGASGNLKQELPKSSFADAFKAMISALTTKKTGVMAGAGEV